MITADRRCNDFSKGRRIELCVPNLMR
jgi:hypothetical protein